MKRTLMVALVAAVATFSGPGAAGAQGDATGTVTVLHGVPGLAVDVYANGDVLIPNFQPGQQFGPTQLPAGEYSLAVRTAGAPAGSDPAISADVNVPAGVNATAVAHLDAGGNPTLSLFANDVSLIEPGSARLTVRHTAAFGPVDVLADGSALVSGLTNGEEASAQVEAGTYSVAVTAAGDPGTQAFSGDLTLEAGTVYLVHATGDPGAGTFDLLVQTVTGREGQVRGVTTGSGGLLAGDGDASPVLVALLAGLGGVGLVLLAGPTVNAALRRR